MELWILLTVSVNNDNVDIFTCYVAVKSVWWTSVYTIASVHQHRVPHERCCFTHYAVSETFCCGRVLAVVDISSVRRLHNGWVQLASRSWLSWPASTFSCILTLKNNTKHCKKHTKLLFAEKQYAQKNRLIFMYLGIIWIYNFCFNKNLCLWSSKVEVWTLNFAKSSLRTPMVIAVHRDP